MGPILLALPRLTQSVACFTRNFIGTNTCYGPLFTSEGYIRSGTVAGVAVDPGYTKGFNTVGYVTVDPFIQHPP